MSRTKQTARLEDWSYVGDRLLGKVFGHPYHTDGIEVQTSTVLSPPDSVKEGGEVETRNTIYTLGKPYVQPDFGSTTNAKEEN